MRIHFIGTRGYVDKTSSKHKSRSSILIETNKSRILVDFGDEYKPNILDQLKPDAIVITHWHPDHAFGLKKVKELDIPVYVSTDSLKSEYYKEEEYKHLSSNFKTFSRNDKFKIINVEFKTIPILHSTKAPNVALIFQGELKRYKVCYASDVASIPKELRDKYLKGVTLYIGDLSTHKEKGLVRKDVKRGDIIGHADIRTQLAWCRDAGIKYAIFTHLGTEPIKLGDKKLQELLDELKEKYNLEKVTVAYDGMIVDLGELELKPEDVESVTPKVFATPQYALILVEPHGKMIYEGTKTAILKSRKFTSHVNEDLYLIADKLCYGIIRLKEPKEISEEEYEKLLDKHKVTKGELKEWCEKEPSWCKFPLYYYEFDFEPFKEPKPIKLKVTGPQVFVKTENIEFLELSSLSIEELEYYHALSHQNQWIDFHYLIATEMISRGVYHLDKDYIDRSLYWFSLIKEKGKDWVNEYIKNIKKYTRAQVGDDFRIVLGWYSSIKRGKKLYKHLDDTKIPITIDDCKKLALAIVKELLRRGASFNKPETYKKYARELFEWVIKQIGEENIRWKELSLKLPEGFEVSDIDVEFVNKLTDEELEELWKWLHDKWKKEFPNGETPENYVNANIFIQIERWKRGLIDYDYEDKDKLDEAARYSWQEYGAVTPLEEEPSGDYITLEEVLDAIQKSGIIPVKGQPFAAYLVGRVVNEGKVPKDHDIDMVFRQNPDPRLIIALKKNLPKWFSDRIHVVFDPCIDENTPILTDKGVKLAKDVSIEDTLLSSKVIKTESYYSVKPCISIKPRMFKEVVVSENHPFLLGDLRITWRKTNSKHHEPNGILTWKLAKELKEGDVLLIPRPKDGLYPQKIDMVKYLPKNAEYSENMKLNLERGRRIARMPYTLKGEWLIYPRGKVKRYIEINKDFMEFAGWYIAEGDNHNGIEITLGLHEMHHAKRIKELIKKVFGLNARIRIREHTILVYCPNQIVSRFLEDMFSKHARNKKLPLWFVNLPQEYLRIFLRAWINGDGSWKKNRIDLCSASPSLREMFKWICYKFGVIPSEYKNTLTIKGNAINRIFPGYCNLERTSPKYWIDDSFIYVKIEKIRKVSPRRIINLETNTHLIYLPFISHNSGPGIGYSVPVYGYALNPLPRELMIRGFGPYRALEELKTGKYIIGVKPKSGWEKWEFWDVKEAWEKWANKHIKNGIWIEEKVDGRRHQIHIMKDGTVKIFTEDTHRDRAKVFPEIVEEFKKMNIPDSILDGEILAFDFPSKVIGKNARAKREIGELVPREDTAAITAAKSLPKDFRERLVLVIYDIMKLKGKDLVNLPYSERRKTYVNLVGNKYKYIDYVRGDLAKTMQDFFRLVKKYRSVSGSEGVVCKDANFKYPVKYRGENRSEDMMKIKNLKEIDVIVLGIKEKKSKKTGEPLGTYMYECYIRIPPEEVKNWYPQDLKEYNGKVYAKIGMSYGTSVKCKIGDIVTIMPIRIRFYTKNGKKRVTWMFPYFKEKKPEKKDADPLSVAEKIAKLGTGPPPEQLDWEQDLETVIRIRMVTCPFYADYTICPLRKRFGIRRAIMNLARVEEEVLKYPVMCPLASIFKCPYLKPYYYGFIGIKYYPELSEEIGYYVNENALPKWLVLKLQGKYMEMPPGEHDFVMESHILTSKFVPGEKKVPEVGSQHMDWRISVNGYLIGWSIVGGNVNKQITPKRLLDNIGKGFRAETKARQPKSWLFKDRPIAKGTDWKAGDTVPEMFDVKVGQGEPRGKMFVMTRGKAIFGVQKPFFHEYFLKDNKYFKDWTRIVVRAVKTPKLDPETKVPIEGKYETLWRVMIPKDQCPYAISNRAMKKGYVPPESNPTPFPIEWTKKHFKEQLEKWLKWLEEKKGIKVELSKIKYTFSMHSWRGPIHVRGQWIRQWYLFLDDKGKGKVRTFRLEGMPPFDLILLAWNEGRDNRKYLEWEGKTPPMSRFNPNKELYGQMKILEKGTVEYKTEKIDGREVITLNFGDRGQFFTGEWQLIQEDPDSDAYTLKRVKKLAIEFVAEKEVPFVLHLHCVGDKNNCHWDIRFKKNSYLDEFNLYGDIRELKEGQEVEAHRKTCYEPDEWFITEGKDVLRKIGPLDTWVTVLDVGTARIIEDNPDFMSMYLNSKHFKNAFFIAKRVESEGYKNWIFRREKEVRGLSHGNPKTGEPYDPYVIEQKSTWNYFRVYLYDPKEFTRAEPPSKVKKYLPDLDIPKGVTIYIGLYPVAGEIHHARVMMIKFDADKWSKEDAIKWIKKNKLAEKEWEMIRERRK